MTRLGDQWYALTTAAWDLKSLELRPRDWASADAAGLPITPLLAKVAEANSGEIKHALRVSFRDEPSSGWDLRTWRQMQGIKMSDMEFVDLTFIRNDPRFSSDRMTARW